MSSPGSQAWKRQLLREDPTLRWLEPSVPMAHADVLPLSRLWGGCVGGAFYPHWMAKYMAKTCKIYGKISIFYYFPRKIWKHDDGIWYLEASKGGYVTCFRSKLMVKSCCVFSGQWCTGGKNGFGWFFQGTRIKGFTLWNSDWYPQFSFKYLSKCWMFCFQCCICGEDTLW